MATVQMKLDNYIEIDYIAKFCKRCFYYRKGCFFDYGDSDTKIPCAALQYVFDKDLDEARHGVYTGKKVRNE